LPNNLYLKKERKTDGKEKSKKNCGYLMHMQQIIRIQKKDKA